MSKGTTLQKELANEEFSRTWKGENDYKILKSHSDSRFGDIKLLKDHKTGEVIFVKDRVATSKKDATQAIYELKERMALNNPNSLRLIDYTVSTQKKLCSTHYLIRSFYQYPNADAKKLLMDHKKNNTSFSGDELQNMQTDVLQSLNLMHAKGKAHGDIRPEYIGFDQKTGKYLLMDRFSDNKTLERLQADYLAGSKDVYMSPNVYSKIKGKNKNVTYDEKKNDYHALGMTLLNLGNQEPVNNYYNDNGTVDNLKL